MKPETIHIVDYHWVQDSSFPDHFYAANPQPRFLTRPVMGSRDYTEKWVEKNGKYLIKRYPTARGYLRKEDAEAAFNEVNEIYQQQLDQYLQMRRECKERMAPLVAPLSEVIAQLPQYPGFFRQSWYIGHQNIYGFFKYYESLCVKHTQAEADAFPWLGPNWTECVQMFPDEMVIDIPSYVEYVKPLIEKLQTKYERLLAVIGNQTYPPSAFEVELSQHHDMPAMCNGYPRPTATSIPIRGR